MEYDDVFPFDEDIDELDSQICPNCGNFNYSADPDMLCPTCRADFGCTYYSEIIMFLQYEDEYIALVLFTFNKN